MRALEIGGGPFDTTVLDPQVLQEEGIALVVEGAHVHSATLILGLCPGGGGSRGFESCERMRDHGCFEFGRQGRIGVGIQG